MSLKIIANHNPDLVIPWLAPEFHAGLWYEPIVAFAVECDPTGDPADILTWPVTIDGSESTERPVLNTKTLAWQEPNGKVGIGKKSLIAYLERDAAAEAEAIARSNAERAERRARLQAKV